MNTLRTNCFSQSLPDTSASTDVDTDDCRDFVRTLYRTLNNVKSSGSPINEVFRFEQFVLRTT